MHSKALSFIIREHSREDGRSNYYTQSIGSKDSYPLRQSYLVELRENKLLMKDVIELTRPRLATLGLITILFAYWLALENAGLAWSWSRASALTIGSLLALCGASVLNQVMEVKQDALMRRTQTRPLADGRVQASAALVLGIGLSVFGTVILWRSVHFSTAIWSLIGEISYLGIYTPLKTRSSLSTVVGAFPGAVPMLIGWSAAIGRVDLAGWVLFAVLFVWQMPHFLAINWMYRSDYERAGFRMLDTLDGQGNALFRQLIAYGLAIIPISLLPTLIGAAGFAYFIGALALGLYYLRAALALGRERTGAAGKSLLKASIVYLPLLYLAMLGDQFLRSLA